MMWLALFTPARIQAKNYARPGNAAPMGRAEALAPIPTYCLLSRLWQPAVRQEQRQGRLVVAGMFSAALGLKGLRLPKGLIDGRVTGLSWVSSPVSGAFWSLLIQAPPSRLSLFLSRPKVRAPTAVNHFGPSGRHLFLPLSPCMMVNFSPSWGLLLLLAFPLAARAQNGVGIGTTAPDASAALDIVSSAKGALLPRLTAAQRTAITRPATGLLVFQTDAPAGFYFNRGTPAAPDWQPMGASGGDNLGNHTATQALQLQGNALIGTGASVGTAVGLGVRADGGLNLGQNTVGNNLYLGFQAGQANTTGSNNVFSGYQSGENNTTGYNNVFSGYQSGRSNTTGNFNVFSGANSGYHNSTGSFNVFSGNSTGISNTTGTGNVFSGDRAGQANTTGSDNVFNGFQSGFNNTTGNFNVFSGYQSGRSNTTGRNNVFSGTTSGYSNTTGSNNVFSGYQSGISNTTGTGNVFSGINSGASNTTGSNNTALGQGAGPTSGALTNATALGYQARVSQSNSLVLGGTGASAVRVGIGTEAPGYLLDVAGDIRVNATVYTSDARFKQQVRPLTGALAAVQLLRGVRYTWNTLGVAHGGTAGTEQVGLLAQEVEKIYPELVSTDREGYKAINYAQLTPVLIEALKELAAQNAALQTRTATAEATTAAFEARLRALEAGSGQAQR